VTISQIFASGVALIVIVAVAYVRSTTKISPRVHVDYLSAEEEQKRLQAKRDAESIRGWRLFYEAFKPGQR
jgi:DNA/RNA-binding domain of Phe-tRNA-synthetase-like protein